MEFLNVENINEIWGYACSGEFEKSIERLEELFRASLDWMRQHMPKDEYINVMYEKIHMTPGEIVKYSKEY